MKNSVLVGAVLALVGLMTTQVQAQHDFGQSSQLNINSDYNSGWSFVSTHGELAIPDYIAAHTSYEVDETTGDVYLYSRMSGGGHWGSLTDNNPWIHLLETQGVHQHSGLDLYEITIGDDRWDYTNLVNLDFHASAELYRNDDNTSLTGSFSGFGNCTGAIPIEVRSGFQFYDFPDPQPAGTYDWFYWHEVKYLVTAEPTLVPAPGSVALAGTGVMFFARRRRSKI